VADQHEFVAWVLFEGFGHVWEDDFARVEPGRVEARVHCAIFAFGRVRWRWVVPHVWQRIRPRGQEVGGGFAVIVARIRHVFLGDGGKVGNGVRDGVGAAKGEDEARVRGLVREGDVAAGVGEERTCVPCLHLLDLYAQAPCFEKMYCDELEALKVDVAAAAQTFEGLLNTQAGGAYTVGDVDDARELLELPKEGLGDERVIARRSRRGTRAASGRDEDDEVHECVEERGHERPLPCDYLHIRK
jgi:hypothetical protein